MKYMKLNKFYILLISFYFCALFFILLAINLIFFEGIPHVPDETAYLFMAKMFASGHVISHIPIPTQFVDYFTEILTVNNGTWLFQYPFGHPLLLAIGVLLGFPNIIPPLIGTLCIFILFFIAREVYDKKTALFLLPLPLLSPFFLENASSFMSHNTAAFYLVLSIFFIIKFNKKGGRLSLLYAGILIGLLFNTRPLTSLPFLLIEATIILLQKKHHKRNIWIFIFGFFLLFIMYLSYNALTTGSALHFQYYSQNQSLFDNDISNLSISFHDRWSNLTILFKDLGPMLFNLPATIIYILLLVPFILRKDIFWDRIFFLSIFTLPFVYFFYNGTFIMYGPRFWYEILPFIFLLTARSLAIFSEKKLRTTISIFILCAALSIAAWLGIIPTQKTEAFSPLKLQELKGFNFTNNGIAETLEKYKISYAVIFVENCREGWWCYGSVFSKNTPALDSPVVYLKDLGDKTDIELRKYYPTKPFYRINYYTHEMSLITY